MDTLLFGRFKDEGTIRGCSWRTKINQYTERKEKVLDMLQTTSIDHAKDMFEHIEWNLSDLRPRDTDRIHLINLRLMNTRHLERDVQASERKQERLRCEV